MIRSDQIDKLAAALSKAQGAIEDADKDATNPHFKSKYSDFASVRAAVRKPLSENGLAYVQLPRTADKSVEVETILMHESGQFIGETLSIPPQGMTAHAIGSALTYAKRYGLMAVVGIASSEDDDDGNEAARYQRPAAKPEAKRAEQTNAPKPSQKPAAASSTPFDDQPTSDMRALISMGDEAAARGSEMLKIWWGGIEPEDRAALGKDRLATWKAEAARADQLEQVPA